MGERERDEERSEILTRERESWNEKKRANVSKRERDIYTNEEKESFRISETEFTDLFQRVRVYVYLSV